MLFQITWTMRPECRDAAIKRFQETAGAPPAGVKLLGRWHSLSQSEGIVIAEATDPTPLGKWCMDWTDLLEMDVMPVVDDEGIGPILGG